MKLSDTESGKKWLAKIKPSDYDVAESLLNDLVLVSNQKLQEGIKRLLFALPRINRKIPFSAIYVPIAPPVKKGRRLKGSKFPNYESSFFCPDGNAYKLNPQNVGSEGRLLNFLRNTYKENEHYIIWPSFDELKNVQRIILIDDCIGSGERVYKFFKWFFENKKLKSLCSRKRIEFYVLSYAMTIQGERNIKKIKRIKKCLSCIELTKGRFFWNKKQYKDYEIFCKSYFSIRPNAFYTDNGIGYNDSFSMIAFEHGIPNNVPYILRRLDLKEPDFNRLFIKNIPNLAKSSFKDLQEKLKSGFSQEQSALIYRFLLFLKGCRSINGPLRMQMAGDYLEMFKDDLKKLVDKCIKMNLIDGDAFLTQNAKHLFKEHFVKDSSDVEINNEFYYY